MRRDSTEFRERFAKWKAGEKVYEAGLPKYGDGTTNVIPEDLQGLSDPQFQPQINEAKVRMTPFVVDDTAYRAQKYHPGTTREQVQELYNNTPYVGSYNKGMLASPSVGAYFSNRDDYPFIRIGQNKPYEIDQMIAHESGHALEDLLFHGRTQQELDLLNKAYGGIPGTKYNEFGQLNRELRHLISKNNNNVIGKDLDNIITNMKDKDLLWLLKNNNLGYTKSAGQTPNLDASAIKRALLDVAQNKYTFDQGNGLMLAKNGKQAVLPLYGGGKSTKKGNYYLPGEKIRRELDVPYDNSSYDYRRANQLGYEPDETGHMPSRDWITGRYLKTPTHPTESLSIYTDLGLGYDVFDKYGNTYSQPNWGSTWQSRLPGYSGGKGFSGLLPINIPGVLRRVYNSVKERAYRTITPQDYNIPKAAKEFVSGKNRNKQDISPVRNEEWARYLGVPYEGESNFEPSPYRPQKGKTYDTVLRFKDESKILSDDALNQMLDRQRKTGKNSWLVTGNGGGLGTYTLSLGEDEKGKYISYYDDWDINPFKGISAKLNIPILSKIEDVVPGSNPYTVYGRRYYQKR